MTTEIKMPQISMTMIDGTIVKWLKRNGDSVFAGEDLVEIQTDKIIDVLRSSLSGVIRKILAKEGEIVSVGGALCLVETTGKQEVEADSIETPQGSLSPIQQNEKKPRVSSARRASPLAKKIAHLKGIDLSTIKGTGPGGLIVKADLQTEVSSSQKAGSYIQPHAPFLDSEDEILPFDRIRQKIADNLMMSKRLAADVTTVADVNMDAIKAIRKILPLSYTAFIITATAKALKEYGTLNALVEEDRIILKKKININVAVATQSGLLTPVITNAGNKNVMTIAEDLADLGERGRKGELKLQDFENGTFTVTNSGTYGSIIFTPILNYPQSAVLGIGRIAMTPIVKNGDIIAAPMMYLSLTYNHRSIDGETAVKFLQRIKHYLEVPEEFFALKRS